MDVALLVQVLEHRRRASNLMHVLHDVLSGGLQIGDEGDLVADALEVLEIELDTSSPAWRVDWTYMDQIGSFD